MTDQPTMTADEFREAQHKLGLSDKQLAAVLGFANAVQVRRLKVRQADLASARPVSATVARLMRAYLDGYRPADWPA